MSYDEIYPVPVNGPFDERYFHQDIEHMTPFERRRDLEAARMRLTIDTNPHPWLLRRIDILEEAPHAE